MTTRSGRRPVQTCLSLRYDNFFKGVTNGSYPATFWCAIPQYICSNYLEAVHIIYPNPATMPCTVFRSSRHTLQVSANNARKADAAQLIDTLTTTGTTTDGYRMYYHLTREFPTACCSRV